MKKFFVLTICILLALGSVSGCTPKETYEIALVTDAGNIDDKSFNQGAWEGVEAFATAAGKTFNYYRPFADSDDARLETIKAAVKDGAKVVVCPGSMFTGTGEAAQEKYPEVNFLLLDVSSGDMTPAKNTALVTYREEQSGFFAGYAAVMDGYRKLGFLGGMALPAVVRFGYGYVQGIDAAARAIGVTGEIEVKYWYCNSFTPSNDIKNKMDKWYASGTEIVFAAGGSIYLSAVVAAEEAGGKVIGVDRDQSGESELIVTSAYKSLEPSVEKALRALYDNSGHWPDEYAGVEVTLGAADNCTGLPTNGDAWRFQTYTVAEYEALYEKVRSGKMEISNAIDAEPAVDIFVDYEA